MKKKKSKKQRSIFRYVPVLLAVIVIAIGAIAFIFQNSFMEFFKTQYSFEDAVNAIEKIDAKYNVSFSDYDEGLEYLYHHPPRDPLNAGEIGPILEDYSRISGDEPVNLLVGFRKNFLEADKYYKLSKKTVKADLSNYGLQCKNEPYIFESIENQNISIQKINESLSSLLLLKEKYPENFAILDISDKWIDLYQDIIIDSQAEITYKIDFFNQFCLNQTNSTN